MTRHDQFEHAALTNVGVKRSHNQDSCTVLLARDQSTWFDKGHVFHVADGMGAHAVGELASKLAVEVIPHTYHKYAHEGIVKAMQKAFTEANAIIHERGQKNPEFEGMGTTSSSLILKGDGAWVGHVGDSRVYRVRGGKIQQLTFDHSLVWEKARMKQVDPDEIQDTPHNVIVRSLGPDLEVVADVHGPYPVEMGDIFLLCSDGLSGPLTDAELGVVAGSLPPAEACQFLIDLANIRGGPDNITCIIVKITQGKKKKGDDNPAEPAKRRKGGIPWPLWILFLGVALAGLAAYLLYEKSPGSTPAFLGAAIAIIGGIIGLFIYHYQEKKRQELEPEYQPRTRVYRETACSADGKLLAKLAKVAETLEQRAKEKKWEVDWPCVQKHRQASDQAKSAGQWESAFREACRAMRPLTEALDRSRHKEESFAPHWEKTGR